MKNSANLAGRNMYLANYAIGNVKNGKIKGAYAISKT